MSLAAIDPACLPNDIRAAGWRVAVHNDYRQNGKDMTFWLFTKDDQCVKGEGLTDRDALNEVRRKIKLSIPETVVERSKDEIDLDTAAKRLVFAMWVYGGYPINSRGPSGCILDTLEIIAPHVRADFANELDAHDVLKLHWPNDDE